MSLFDFKHRNSYNISFRLNNVNLYCINLANFNIIVLELYHGPEDFTKKHIIKFILLLLCYSCVEFAIHVAMS